ncbi:uncharacterized protein LOC135342978 [Halichondria panicea]|uniref:uncharacterized protein LOC135342978 n=1 Tax=Halichondria panicea TaxID=6063 RepID=UPI00312B4D31
MFPSRERTRVSERIGHTLSFNLFCLCRMPEMSKRVASVRHESTVTDDSDTEPAKQRRGHPKKSTVTDDSDTEPAEQRRGCPKMCSVECSELRASYYRLELQQEQLDTISTGY